MHPPSPRCRHRRSLEFWKKCFWKNRCKIRLRWSLRLSTRHHRERCRSRQMLWQLEAWKASPRAWMYAIVWSETKRVGVVAAWMESGLLGRSWQSYRRFARTAGTCSVYCDKTGRGTWKLKMNLQNIWRPLQSFRRDVSLLGSLRLFEFQCEARGKSLAEKI